MNVYVVQLICEPFYHGVIGTTDEKKAKKLAEELTALFKFGSTRSEILDYFNSRPNAKKILSEVYRLEDCSGANYREYPMI